MHVNSPDNSDASIELAIQAAGADVAPRVKPDQVEALIASEHYFTAGQAMYPDAPADQRGPFGEPARPAGPLDLLTICVLVLRNGFTVVGEGACASPENFKAHIGRRIARDNAKQKVWPLLGYVLREQLHREQAAAAAGGEAWPAPNQP